MHWFLIGAAGLHLVFMVAELFPWGLPKLLRILSEKLPEDEPFKDAQQKLVATIVHNAGIYNGIVAGGLLWASFGGDSAKEVARVMLLGAAVAGIFGTATLKSWVPAVQAAVGLVGLILVW
jgi:uncharacterized membrane protein